MAHIGLCVRPLLYSVPRSWCHNVDMTQQQTGPRLASLLQHSQEMDNMSDVKAQRRLWVQELRRIAGKCDVNRVPDNAGRHDVHNMVAALFQTPGLQPYIASK